MTHDELIKEMEKHVKQIQNNIRQAQRDLFNHPRSFNLNNLSVSEDMVN